MHGRRPETHRSRQQLQVQLHELRQLLRLNYLTLNDLTTHNARLIMEYDITLHAHPDLHIKNVCATLAPVLLFCFQLDVPVVSLPEHRGRRRPTPTHLVATPYSRSSSGGRARCMASSRSSTWQGTRGGLIHPVLTAKLAWRGPRSTKACWPSRFVGGGGGRSQTVFICECRK